MAAERKYTAETIVNLKRALTASSDASESDDSISYPSNRGRKLKRKARFVHEGALNDAKGPRTYKEEIEYFGKRRKIIWRKERPRRQLSDADSESFEESSEDERSVDDADPYADVKLDKILAPLDSAADLPAHPSLSHIYTTTTLNELLQQSLDKLCEEHAHTTKLKNLLTVFLGDDPYVNLAKMEWGTEDYAAVARERGRVLLRELAGRRDDEVDGVADRDRDGDRERVRVEEEGGGGDVDGDVDVEGDVDMDVRNGETQEDDPDATQELKLESLTPPAPPAPSAPVPVPVPVPPPPQAPRRMTTRSTHASHPPPPPPTTSASPPVEIDPFFYPPTYTVDRNFGLPPPEAEDTRRLLATAVQRQDEFLRGLNKVRDGLLRAERCRRAVWGWCRGMEGVREYLNGAGAGAGAGGWRVEEEDGVGVLEDGEDWYDAELWGLEEPLEKGKEEEEEGEVVVQGKKTRGRRTVGN